MNGKIEQLIVNAHSWIINRIYNKNDINNDEKLEINKKIIKDLYDADLEEKEKANFSFEEFIEKLKILLTKVEPTQSIAESHELETWLDNSIRNNPEIRFKNYKHLLCKEGKGSIIEQLEADTYKILDSCHNPNILKNKWDRRGLVYGHVQSGKTSNYIGLINRALDSGYKIIIVLTGMTEDLRKQTQERIDYGIIGKSNGLNIGIGTYGKTDEIISATSINYDLKGNIDYMFNNLSLDKKSIWVIKKNKTVLENLIIWLDKQRKNEGTDKIDNVPFLIIDDEADNGSIQSISKKEFELWETGLNLDKLDFENLSEDQEKKLNEAREAVLKAINRYIRVFLSLLSHKTFVAYTATPYSIISGKSEDLEREVKIKNKIFKIEANSDLFPEHFIIPIKPGENYLGVEKIFNENKEMRLPLIIDINELVKTEKINNIFPSSRGSKYAFDKIPKSLEDAILHFLITILIRKYRGQKDYNTLLIHTSNLTKNTDYVANKVSEFLTKLQGSLGRADEEKYFEKISNLYVKIKKNSENELFKTYFNKEYEYPLTLKKEEFLNILEGIDIVSYHSSNDTKLKHKNHTLNYDIIDNDTRESKFRNYIVIGGNRLSRGITLKGLTTSYFVRNSTRQDSLYQMGRWFGYRDGYEDLVRIYMPKEQISWYENIYKLEYDLRKNFENNNDEDIKILPRNAIIKLAYHTNETIKLDKENKKRIISICDPNKLRNTSKQPFSFSGPLKTNKIINNSEIQKRNFMEIKSFIESIKNNEETVLYNNREIPKIVKNNNINFTNVDYNYILNLLDEYEAHKEIQTELNLLSTFIKENNKEINKWSVVLAQKPENKQILENINWRLDYYNKNNIIENQEVYGLVRKWEELENTNDTKTISNFLDRNGIDNSFDIIDSNNENEFIEDYKKANQKYRNQKKIPILIIYPVVYKQMIFPLLYFILPVINGGKKVNYIVRINRNI